MKDTQNPNADMRWHKVIKDRHGREWDVFAVPRQEGTCPVCSKPLVQPKGQGRRRVYCSSLCQSTAYHSKRLVQLRGGWW